MSLIAAAAIPPLAPSLKHDRLSRDEHKLRVNSMFGAAGRSGNDVPGAGQPAGTMSHRMRN